MVEKKNILMELYLILYESEKWRYWKEESHLFNKALINIYLMPSTGHSREDVQR